MPFVLEGLAHQELTRFNADKWMRDKVADPFRSSSARIMTTCTGTACTEAGTPGGKDGHQEQRPAHEPADGFPSLCRNSPCGARKRRILLCILQNSSKKLAGASYSTQALETRHKSSIKAAAHKTNNQASLRLPGGQNPKGKRAAEGSGGGRSIPKV